MLDESIKKELDQLGMQDAILSFPNQIEFVLDKMYNWLPIKKYSSINNIVILGMGGSAIGGDLAKVLIHKSCRIPIFINRSYDIPEWVNSKTLVLCSSYSGNTEETISSFNQCIKKKCHIIVLSSGGLLLKHSLDLNLDKILIPEGYQPRAAIGFSFMSIISVLVKLDFVSDDYFKKINDAIEPLKKLGNEMKQIDSIAYNKAKEMHETCPIIYGSEELTWIIALRLRGQLAENAKMLAFHHNFPEQNHNEIEGWTMNKKIMKMLSIIWIHDIDNHSATQKRMDISSLILKNIPNKQITISISGENYIERILKLVHFVDWISYYSALLNNVDPTPVNRIQELKKQISKK